MRYLVLLWCDASAEQCAHVRRLSRKLVQGASTWRRVFSAAGLSLFVTGKAGDHLQILPRDAGVLLGDLYARDRDVLSKSACPSLHLNEGQTSAIVESGGQWLIDNAFGNYIAVTHRGDTSWVLKDPVGELPCFSTTHQNVTVIFSRLEDYRALEFGGVTVNQRFLESYLVLGSGTGRIRPMQEVVPVARGECVAFRRASDATMNRASRLRWTPSSFRHAADPIEDEQYAKLAVRNTVLSVTHTLARPHPISLLRLSGGLDSSIIAGCLKHDPQRRRVVAYTYRNPVGRSSEVPWARRAAEGLSEYLISDVSASKMDLKVGLEMESLVEPMSLLLYLQRRMTEESLIRQTQATAIFNGDGGDSGFCAESVSYGLIDYLAIHGFTREIFPLAGHIALHNKRTAWHVLGKALKHQWARPVHSLPLAHIRMATRLVRPGLVDELTKRHEECSSHPWFDGHPDLPWHTTRRLGMLMKTPEQLFYGDSGPLPEVISPLYAQPVMELLLRIPIHVHFLRGRDRGLARAAFAGLVPPENLERVWKDRAPGFQNELNGNHRAWLREMLLDGVLASRGLLNRTEVDNTLSDKVTKSEALPGEVAKILDLELWARRAAAT